MTGKSIPLLKTILADAFILYTKTLNYHWNVVGTLFPQLHSFFEEQYQALQEDVDIIAERLRALQSRAPGTLKEFLALTTLQENDENVKDRDMVSQLLADRETMVAFLKKALDDIADQDPGTANLLEDMLEKHEKQAWMLRAILG